jgi:mersacidin/lichenicidin family type 2 lantibiotic
MTHETIIRAWRDPEYRSSLTDEERSVLPVHPAGLLELDDADLAQVVGGKRGGKGSRSRSRSRSRGRS